MILFTWIILAYGLSQILVYGSIFDAQRQWIHAWADSSPILKFISGLISCMMCTSTWVGFFLSWVMFSPTSFLYDTPNWISWFFDGMFASGGVWAVNAIIEYYENKK